MVLFFALWVGALGGCAGPHEGLASLALGPPASSRSETIVQPASTLHQFEQHLVRGFNCRIFGDCKPVRCVSLVLPERLQVLDSTYRTLSSTADPIRRTTELLREELQLFDTLPPYPTLGYWAQRQEVNQSIENLIVLAHVLLRLNNYEKTPLLRAVESAVWCRLA
jgi:hypothetical protein